MKKQFLSLSVICILATHSFSQNSTGMPSGNIGIGTTSPGTLLHVQNTASPTTVGGEADAVQISNHSDNNSYFRFLFRRHTAGTNWFGVASRLQFTTETSKQAFIEFNPLAADGYLAGLALGADNTEAMRIRSDGNIGINTTSPQSKMHIYGGNMGVNANDIVKNARITNGCGSDNANIDFYAYRSTNGNSWLTASTRIEHNINNVKQGFVEFNPPGMLHGMALGTDNTQRLYINSAGQVGIGTANINGTDYKLYVETGIRTRKVKVDVVTWSDYVFNNDYHLMPLAGVEKFIEQNGHLPGVPSAKDVEQQGIDLAETQATLLKKIEELTLYMIEQNKTQQAIMQEVKQLKEENKQLKQLLKK